MVGMASSMRTIISSIRERLVVGTRHSIVTTGVLGALLPVPKIVRLGLRV